LECSNAPVKLSQKNSRALTAGVEAGVSVVEVALEEDGEVALGEDGVDSVVEVVGVSEVVLLEVEAVVVLGGAGKCQRYHPAVQV
jgi:hypothetical protein